MANSEDKLITIATAEEGYLEKTKSAYVSHGVNCLYDKTKYAGADNYTKYWYELNNNMQGQPWCQAFVNWIFEQAYGKAEARKLLCSPNEWSYYTPTAAGYFKAKGQWHTKDPQPGDVIYFKNSERICHVGIVKAVKGNTITTIEGNTSSAVGIVPNGGGVFEKHYTFPNSRIAGYGRPTYDTEVKLGWIKSCDKWYYRIAPDQNAHGWVKIKNADGRTRWYHFKPDGEMDKGWTVIDGNRYYLEENGDLEGACYITDKYGVQRIWIVE